VTDENQADVMKAMAGKKFLYQQPELLTNETHGAMGITPSARPFEFAKKERSIPLTMVEISSAQRHYPVVFSSIEDPVPLAVVGLPGTDNLYIDEQGNWDPSSYVPSYLRCYPFALAAQDDGSRMLVADRAAASITEDAQFPFFINNEASPEINAVMQFCVEYDEERKRTTAFSQLLVKHGLLASLQANYNTEGSSESKMLATYVGINIQKLSTLDPKVVVELHQAGWLAPMYLMHYSMESWRTLRLRGDAVAAAQAESDVGAL
jgi:hypothetical protein